MTGKTVKTTVLALALTGLAGCSRTEKAVTQNIMPAAINYYVLTKEIHRLRMETKALPAEQISGQTAKYAEIVRRGQQMKQELAAMGNFPKYQDFLAALDSSLQTQVLFLQHESQALAALAEYRRAESEIDRIERQTSGNTLARARHQAELDQLDAAARRSSGLLESLRPKLAALSRKNCEEMRLYNQMVLERKILNYTAGEELLALFDWEQPRTTAKAAVKKAAPKKTMPKKKPGK